MRASEAVPGATALAVEAVVPPAGRGLVAVGEHPDGLGLQRGQQRGLGGEVGVDRAHRAVDPVGDLLHGEVVDARLGQDGARGLDELLVSQRPVPGPSSGVDHARSLNKVQLWVKSPPGQFDLTLRQVLS